LSDAEVAQALDLQLAGAVRQLVEPPFDPPLPVDDAAALPVTTQALRGAVERHAEVRARELALPLGAE
jgi:hypothetical protein